MHRALFLLFPLLALAADPAGFGVWKSADLKGIEKKLGPKMDSAKVATESLARYDNHNLSVAHREASGQAEIHVNVTDVFVIESGEGTVVVGGKVPNQRTTAPGEIRGATIEGGSRHAVAAGDVVHIPANVPHQLLLEPGKQITYFVVKVNSK